MVERPRVPVGIPVSRIVTCPNCAGQVSIEPALNGKTVVCPHCGTQFVAGAAPAAKPPDDPFPFLDGASRRGPYRGARHLPGRRKKNDLGVVLAIMACLGLGVTAIVGFLILSDTYRTPTNASGERDSIQHGGSASPATVSQRGTVTPVTKATPIDESAEARRILAMALDSWTFGDAEPDFLANHPEINNVFMLDWTVNTRLLRYEINAQRKQPEKWEFTLRLIFQSEAGHELPRPKIGWVHKTASGKWSVSVLNPY